MTLQCSSHFIAILVNVLQRNINRHVTIKHSNICPFGALVWLSPLSI